MKTFVDPSPREYRVSRLRLDPNNPRLRLHPGGSTEKDIIERMCRMGSQSPSQVVKHMLTDGGFLHNEIPVVLKEPGSSDVIVIDGNRRVSALKMVLTPSLIPSTRRGLRVDCERLSGLVPDKIRCWVTHTRSDAKRIVYRAHNEGSREWETLSKYAAHYDYYNDGVPIADIVELTGLSQASVVKQINMWILVEAMIEHIAGFEIESAGITSFERVTTHNADFPARLGISLSGEGIYQVPPNATLIQLLHRIYLSSAKTSGFTRDVENNPEARKEFLDEHIPADFGLAVARDATTSIRQKGEIVLNATTTNRQADPPPSGAEARRPPGVPPLPTERQILGVKKNVGPKAHAIFKEYAALSQPPQDYPIASAALTRAMIEATLKYHAKRLNCYEEALPLQVRQHSEAIDAVATKLKQKLSGMSLPYSADMLSAISTCCKAVSELNDVMHKDGTFAARSAVRSSLASLASVVKNLVEVPS